LIDNGHPPGRRRLAGWAVCRLFLAARPGGDPEPSLPPRP